MKYKYTKKDASEYGWEGLRAFNFKFEDIESGMSVIIVESEVPHGKVTTKDRKRIYYILEGRGEFKIGEEGFDFQEGDLIVIPPKTEYDYKPSGDKIRALLIMELLDK